MGFKDIEKDNNGEYELPDDKWLRSYYTYAGDVFDTPEHQAILSQRTSVKERLAYKEKILNQQYFEKIGKYLDED